jgi:beta-glucosidase
MGKAFEMWWRTIITVTMAATFSIAPGQAQDYNPADRAVVIEAQMTDDERLQLLHSVMTVSFPGTALPEQAKGVKPMAGYVPGIDRLGVPSLTMTDASLGVTNPLGSRPGDWATALPSSLSLAASFDPGLAYASGAMVGREARAKGFNVLLSGGANLARDWFGGRNFEYLGEDPLLAGVLAGESIRGTQDQKVIATVKHFSLNSQETLRHWLDARIDEAAHRESDLLAFQIAIERGQPGSVMAAYNKVNGVYASENSHLLTRVLKEDWAYPGWVMSDWGAVHGIAGFAAGLDQQSGAQLDEKIWFGAPLREALAVGNAPANRLSDAVRRILQSIFAVGADWPKMETAFDDRAHAALARRSAAEGMVLLKNDGILPLANAATRILVVGGYADAGVMSGFGSSQVTPKGGHAAVIPVGGRNGLGQLARQHLLPSSPLRALRAALPDATISYNSGYFLESAAAEAQRVDLVVVVATQWQSEVLDGTSFHLPLGQDGLIAAVAAANSNVVVVLQTGNPVAMPWLDKVRGVLQAWYPGQEGGPAIADILSGAVNPSGRLPISFPVAPATTPRALPPGLGEADGTAVAVDYSEGSDVGYRWQARQRHTPLFAFGHGLSYTRFEQGALEIPGREARSARVTVRNSGTVAGSEVVQLYYLGTAKRPTLRLAGFAKLALQPGEERTVDFAIERRVLAEWSDGQWEIDEGEHRFALGRSAIDLDGAVAISLAKARFGP